MLVIKKRLIKKTLAKEEVVEQIDLKEKIGQILKNKSNEENKKSEQALKKNYWNGNMTIL